MAHKILGTDDAVNACDCCGKTNLKFTVAVEVDGEVMHYGSTCATRHTGKTSKEISQAIKTALEEKQAAARKAYRDCPERIALEVKMADARRNGIKPGKEFADFCRAESQADAAAFKAIKEKFGVSYF